MSNGFAGTCCSDSYPNSKSFFNSNEGLLSASGLRVAVVAARWNSIISDLLVQGAGESFLKHGGTPENFSVYRVPGCFEIPVVCRALSEKAEIDGIVALGALLKGETDHYQYICQSLVSGITQIELSSGKPIGFGVIQADSLEQAMQRAGGKVGNKGWEATISVVETLQLLRKISGG